MPEKKINYFLTTLLGMLAFVRQTNIHGALKKQYIHGHYVLTPRSIQPRANEYLLNNIGYVVILFLESCSILWRVSFNVYVLKNEF